MEGGTDDGRKDGGRERRTTVGRIKTARDACAENVIIAVIVVTFRRLNDARSGIQMPSRGITMKTRGNRGGWEARMTDRGRGGGDCRNTDVLTTKMSISCVHASFVTRLFMHQLTMRLLFLNFSVRYT